VDRRELGDGNPQQGACLVTILELAVEHVATTFSLFVLPIR
jgi:hypothetical protein